MPHSGPFRDTSPSAENFVTTEEVSVVESACRVCGLDEGEDRWTGRDGAQYVICSCCGAEAGVDDVDVAAVRHYRTDWQNEGAAWFSPEDVRPTGGRTVRWSGSLPPGGDSASPRSGCP